jgi:hypothetical protein
MVGVFELLPKPNLPQPANNPGNYLIWFREPKSIGAVKDQIATYVPVSLAAWTPPAPGQTLAPFVSGAKAQLSVEATLLGKFQIPKTNAGAVFEAAASAPQLFFNPVDGTFRGSFTDVTVSTKPRRIFQGVLLQKSGLNKGFGFFLSESASLPVLVSP